MCLLIYFTFIIEPSTATWMDDFCFLSVEIFQSLPTFGYCEHCCRNIWVTVFCLMGMVLRVDLLNNVDLSFSHDQITFCIIYIISPFCPKDQKSQFLPILANTLLVVLHPSTSFSYASSFSSLHFFVFLSRHHPPLLCTPPLLLSSLLSHFLFLSSSPSISSSPFPYSSYFPLLLKSWNYSGSDLPCLDEQKISTFLPMNNHIACIIYWKDCFMIIKWSSYLLQSRDNIL